MDVEELVRGVLAGERRAVARAISAVEDGDAGLEGLSEGIFASTGRAATVGLTGAPGVGKSTLAAGLVAAARSRELRAAVLAVDPTSPYTGGALLGDRVRMQEHATDPSVFIRSMATRGHLGGMALAAPEAVRILDAAGYDRVVVETVGVGQAEVDVAAATDTAVVVLAPGLGDAVQMAKAGILEVADVFVVNKADRDGAPEVVRELRQMLHLGAAREWDPPVLSTSAVDAEGIESLWEAIEAHRTHLGVDRGARRQAPGTAAARGGGPRRRALPAPRGGGRRTRPRRRGRPREPAASTRTRRRLCWSTEPPDRPRPAGPARPHVTEAPMIDEHDASEPPRQDRSHRSLSGEPVPALVGPPDAGCRSRGHSGCRVPLRTPAGCIRRCTADGCGRCGSSPGSARPRRPTSGTGSCSNTARGD